MKISVALCTYNGEKYIAEQIRSIVSQTKSVHEIIISDDGSTDSTIAIINKLQENYPYIKLYKNTKTLNIVKNFEKAINLCSGDLIFLSDQDDIWFSDKVSKLVTFFQQNPEKEAVFHNLQFFPKEKFHNTTFQHYLFPLCEEEELLKHIILRGNVVTGAALAFRNKGKLLFENSTTFLHDNQLALHFAMRKKLGPVNEVLGYYRIHDKQQIGSGLKFDPFQEKLKILFDEGNFYSKMSYLEKVYHSNTTNYPLIDISEIKNIIKLEMMVERNSYLSSLSYLNKKWNLLKWYLKGKYFTKLTDLIN